MDILSARGRLSEAVRAFVAKPHRLLIGDAWVDAKPGERFAAFDPASGQQIAQVAEGGAADIDAAVTAARITSESGPWPRMEPTVLAKTTPEMSVVREEIFGSIWSNVHNFNDVALPFGGHKQSGWGREMGYEAIELCTETKAVAARL